MRATGGSLVSVKRFKALLAVMLLPVCVGAGQSVVHLIRATSTADTVWAATGAGIVCWLLIYLSLPKPMWVYVFGHELTHALWTWIFGGRVKRFKASAKGGHVVVTRNNFVVALAPYFFPIYAVSILTFFGLGRTLFGWTQCLVWCHLLIGAAYAFHLTLTWHVLKMRQSDIVEQGYLFSAVVIWLGNLAVLLFGIPLLTGRIGMLTALGWCWMETGELFQRLGKVL
jgi:hypothetical protein